MSWVARRADKMDDLKVATKGRQWVVTTAGSLERQTAARKATTKVARRVVQKVAWTAALKGQHLVACLAVLREMLLAGRRVA